MNRSRSTGARGDHGRALGDDPRNEPPADDAAVDVVALMGDVVLPVLRSMLRDEQLEDLRLSWEGKPPRRGRSDLMLTVVVEGEELRWFTGVPNTWARTYSELRARFASDLQDFIAESRFGWGQLRTYDGD